MEAASPYLKLVGRILLAIIFIQSGFHKIGGYEGLQAAMESKGVPAILAPLVVLLELGGGIAIVLGLFTRWTAIALAGFCILAAILFHPPADPKEMSSFMKDITIAGGFLVLAGGGPGALALDNRWR
ncbi:MAG: DoxX family protein [Methyloceanibacter sp.]